ncbi:MAG: 3'-5' exonuclease [Clostridia bacterium]|nr:3'-5' exonuclease [Clostridia bacterium]
MNIYFNIETSGLSVGEEGKKDARILSITAIKTDGDILIDKFATFVACGEYLPKYVREITGISNKLLKGAPRTRTALKSFKEFAGDNTLISYNIAFDMSFLKFYGAKYGIKFDNPQIDLLPLAKEQLKGKVPNFSIKTVSEFFGISLNQSDVDIIYEIGKVLL